MDEMQELASDFKPKLKTNVDPNAVLAAKRAAKLAAQNPPEA